MKQLKTIFTLLLASALLWACSDDNDEPGKTDAAGAYAKFMRSEMSVGGAEGTAEAVVDWKGCTWEITLGEGGIVSAVTPASGGDAGGVLRGLRKMGGMPWRMPRGFRADGRDAAGCRPGGGLRDERGMMNEE